MSTALTNPSLQDLIQSVRDLLNQPDPNNSYWSDDELTRYLNEGVRIHMAELIDINEGYTTTVTTLNIVNGSETIALPSDLFLLKAVYKVVTNGAVMLPYRNNLTEGYYTDGGTNTQTYLPYYYFRGRNIVLRPAPQFNETAGIQIEYDQLPQSMVDGADIMDAQISALFRQSVEMYGVYKAKLKESLTNNIRVHDVAAENFNDLFKQFKNLSARRSRNPTAIIPFNPESF